MNKHSSKNNTLNSSELKELQALRDENSRLKTLLKKHGISWERTDQAIKKPLKSLSLKPSHISTSKKVALFRSLFRGRVDVYPLRWESKKGHSGYSPACGNQWKTGICNKPRIKCGDCENRLLLPVTDQVIYDHLAGKHTVGVYPLLTDDTCYFLSADFDKDNWQEDAQAFAKSCYEFDIPAIVEISRSGNGAHVWIFFSEPVSAREARQLGTALISYTCNSTRQLTLGSYDRLFPNQDRLPKGGFGNLIALPLQKQPRSQGFSLFVDENFTPYPDQWEFLKSVKTLNQHDIENGIIKACGGKHPLDISFVVEDDNKTPWKQSKPVSDQISGKLPESLSMVRANQIFIQKEQLPQKLSNRLIRLAAFQNPEFYKAQNMRRSVWRIDRIICCAENFSHHIGLPRGCWNELEDLLEKNNIAVEVQDERVTGPKIAVKFTGKLRKDQKAAVSSIMKHELGVLCAPTAFGKTVCASALISKRKVSTMILVHRTELLRQWQERLTTFLNLQDEIPGVIGGGKNTLTGKIDIAVMQSLSRREDLLELLENYGQIIIDECHHISAVSFESILKQAKAKYIIGLTATPNRRDGQHPIIFMQCGPIRHKAQQPENAPACLEVWPRKLPAPEIPADSSIQDIFQILIDNENRNQTIIRDIFQAYDEGRKILVLTERTEHIEMLQKNVSDRIENCFVLHGRLPKKKRTEIIEQLTNMEATTPHVIIATGRLIGEGFDHPPLDTLVLSMPVSWKGTLQQYAGRLHREHVDKRDVRIYDYVEIDQPQLSRMWNKRQKGYRAMGYQIKSFE